MSYNERDDRTVCVWEAGGVHPAHATAALERDIADALGATHDCVEIKNTEHVGDGVWLTVCIQAPYVLQNWAINHE